MSDLLYGEVEDDVRASVRRLLRDRADWPAVLARIETDEPTDTALWRSLGAELGMAGLLVPEEFGGAGAGPREVAVVLEELGRTVAPVPFLASAVLATSALLAAAEPSAAAGDLLGALAAGERTAALAVPFGTAPDGPLPTVDVDGDGPQDGDGSRDGGPRDDGDGVRLSGRVRGVADLVAADVVLVAAGPDLYAVDLPGDGATVTPVTTLDLTRRLADLDLAGAPARRVAGDAEAAVRRALTVGAGLLASEQLGVAEWCLGATVEYVKTRYQFGRPIGSFQALKHRLADVWAELSSARAVARAAADALATGEDVEVAVAMAQAFCADVAVHAAEECVQMHGGIGMTWEHPAHLYLVRAKSAQIALGTPERHRAALARLVDLAPA